MSEEKDKTLPPKHPNWHQKNPELIQMAIECQKDPELTRECFLMKIREVLGDLPKVRGIEGGTISFLEFCFYRADGPYSPKFNFYTVLLKKIFALYRPLADLLDSSADAAIANMVLGAIGKLKFEISDLYELGKVLDVWKLMGLKPQSVNSIFKAVMAKKVVQEKIKNRDIFLLARIREIFPMFQDRFLPADIDLDAAIFDHYKSRFKALIEGYEQEGKSIQEMIQNENKRVMPVGISRNNFLAYLVKKSQNFRCQVCNILKTGGDQAHEVEAHHITLLSQGGMDQSDNLIVLCKKHHKEVHTEKLRIESLERIHIEYEGKNYSLNYSN